MVRIRPVERQDMPAVIALLQDVSSFAPPEGRHQSIWAAFDAQPHVHGVVAVTGESGAGCVVGFGALCMALRIRGGAVAYIEDVVVAPDQRRRGVGELVVQALVEIAVARKCYKVALECRAESRGFYESVGFTETGVAMSRLLMTGVSLDA